MLVPLYILYPRNPISFSYFGKFLFIFSLVLHYGVPRNSSFVLLAVYCQYLQAYRTQNGPGNRAFQTLVFISFSSSHFYFIIFAFEELRRTTLREVNISHGAASSASSGIDFVCFARRCNLFRPFPGYVSSNSTPARFH